MRHYKTLIFDLDDTLINNDESLKYAFFKVLEKLGVEYKEEMFSAWKTFDTSYWHSWETGNMPIPDFIHTLEDKITYLRANRFILFFKDLQIDFNQAILLNTLYCQMLGVNIVEIEGAHQLLEELYRTYEIMIATNGPKNAAIDKLEKARLNAYISTIISSEEIGFSKPMPEFFEFLYTKTSNKDQSTMLLIGDSLTTDVLGGMRNNIDTCWFNPKNILLPKGYEPTMTIQQLLQLKKKL